MKAAHIGIAILVVAPVALWYFGGGSKPSSLLARDGLSVTEPVTHKNLTVFFLRGPDRVDDSRVVTLQEALEKNWAVVHETGSVNELQVENLMEDRSLFLQSGDIIKGGQQDRMIALDMLVPAKSGKLPVPSHCVESARWSGREGEAVSHFNKSDNIAVGNGIKLANAYGNQDEVWKNVGFSQAAFSQNLGVQVNANASPTSLQLTLEHDLLRQSVGDFDLALRRAGEREPGIVGVVFVVNGQVTSAEIYGSNGLFKKVWPRLLKSAAAEAVATKAEPPARAMGKGDVESFLLAANQPHSASVSHEGGPHSIDRVGTILIEGNTITQDRVLLSNLDLRPGERVPSGGTGDVIREVADLLETNQTTDQVAASYNPGRSIYGNAFYQRQGGEPRAPAILPVAHRAIDNDLSLQTETRVPASGNALLHRSVLSKPAAAMPASLPILQPRPAPAAPIPPASLPNPPAP